MIGAVCSVGIPSCSCNPPNRPLARAKPTNFAASKGRGLAALKSLQTPSLSVTVLLLPELSHTNEPHCERQGSVMGTQLPRAPVRSVKAVN